MLSAAPRKTDEELLMELADEQIFVEKAWVNDENKWKLGGFFIGISYKGRSLSALCTKNMMPQNIRTGDKVTGYVLYASGIEKFQFEITKKRNGDSK